MAAVNAGGAGAAAGGVMPVPGAGMAMGAGAALGGFGVANAAHRAENRAKK